MAGWFLTGTMNRTNPNSGAALLKGIVMIVCFVAVGLALLLGFLAGKKQARDHERLSDVAKIAGALAQYKEFNQVYPESANGQPKDFSGYLEYWPEAPRPADGACRSTDNGYYYEQLDQGNSYRLTFCLGRQTNGYGPGLVAVSQ
jgi:hypothetical protein